jgi:hypothetical protein
MSAGSRECSAQCSCASDSKWLLTIRYRNARYCPAGHSQLRNGALIIYISDLFSVPAVCKRFTVRTDVFVLASITSINS